MDKNIDVEFRGKCFFDSNVFIYAFDMQDEYAHNVLENAIAEDSAITSVISVTEVYTGYYRTKRPAQALLFKHFLVDNYIGISPISFEIAEFAGELRGRIKGLKTPDALQLACARINGCRKFYTNDKRLKKIKINDMEIITIDDLRTQ